MEENELTLEQMKELESIGIDSLTKSIITTAIFIILIYGGYFILTYLCNKNIINKSE